MKKLFTRLTLNAIGAFLGSCVTLLWQSKTQAVSMFIAFTIAITIGDYLSDAIEKDS